MKIVADENIPYVKEAFESLGTVTTLKGREINSSDLKQTDILLVRSVTQVNKKLLDNTTVKFVASATAGFNHIDLDYLKAHDIGFARAPGSNAISAAEYVIAGICKWSLQQKQTFQEFQQLKVGIIGYGNVGSRVKRLCDSFAIKCIINDPPLQETSTQADKPLFESIDAALACDIVTLHVPLFLDGEHRTDQLINQTRIQQLKPGSLFINASRGEVVEEAALLSRMKKSRMQNKNDLSLILDVWENEPKINLEMLKHTIIGTPHIAGYSFDGKIRGTEMIYKACSKFLGKQPQWSSRQVDFGDHHRFDFKKTVHEDKRKAILKAYDIMADDARLRRILEDKTLTDGQYFDSLRKNYPVRREFSELAIL